MGRSMVPGAEDAVYGVVVLVHEAPGRGAVIADDLVEGVPPTVVKVLAGRFVDEVIRPSLTRARLIEAFDSLDCKRDTNPTRMQSNLPV